MQKRYFFIQEIRNGATLALCVLNMMPFTAYAGPSCETLLKGDTALVAGNTAHLINYLKQLTEHSTLGRRELLRFFKALEEQKIINPISEEDAELNVGSAIHRKGLEKLLGVSGQSRIDQNVLLEWVRGTLKAMNEVDLDRTDVREKTLYWQIEFAPIQPGKILGGDNLGRIVINELTHPFRVMKTPVTQRQWSQVMGENPSHFAQGADSELLTINDKQIRMRPDNPVENITWWSAVEFANRLSVRDGLKPAYDLSGVQFAPGTRAEDGTLMALDPKADVKINAPDEDIYQAQGYRLPTDAEQEYLLSGADPSRWQYNSLYTFGSDSTELKKHAWYFDNSDKSTHAVGLLEPLRTGVHEIYDLHGNVAEWGHDFYNRNPTAGINPSGPRGNVSRDHTRVLRGGSWNDFSQNLTSSYRWGAMAPNTRLNTIGFRLVLTSKF